MDPKKQVTLQILKHYETTADSVTLYCPLCSINTYRIESLFKQQLCICMLHFLWEGYNFMERILMNYDKSSWHSKIPIWQNSKEMDKTTSMSKLIARCHRKPLGSFGDDAIGRKEKYRVLRSMYVFGASATQKCLNRWSQSRTNTQCIDRTIGETWVSWNRHLHSQWHIVCPWPAQHIAPPATKTIHTTVWDLLHPSKSLLGEWSLYVPQVLTFKKPYVLPTHSI